MITEAQVKQQLALEPTDVADAPLIATYISAVRPTLENQLNRKLFDTQAALDAAIEAQTAGEAPLLVTDDLRIAALMLVAHWYTHREAVSEMRLNTTPMAMDYLLKPYRRIIV